MSHGRRRRRSAFGLLAAAAVLIAVAIAAACTTVNPAPVTLPTVTITTAPPAAPAPTPAPSGAIDRVPVSGHVTGTLTGPCHLRDHGTEPDPSASCTPGAVAVGIGPAQLCPHLTQAWDDLRPPSSETTRIKYTVVAPAYGQTRDDTGELDHFIPRALGGANDLSNLWLQEGPIPNMKDPVEVKLHTWVCQGATTAAQAARLAEAQAAIAHDWHTALAQVGAG